MSFDFNYKFWVTTKKDIERVIKIHNALAKRKPISKPSITYRVFSELYVLYAELVKKLTYLYHHTYQVQKRKVVRELTESAIRRFADLKNELKNLELSEYVYTDRALITRKLTPYDLMIWRSPQFLHRRPPELQNVVYENKLFMDEEEREEMERKVHEQLKVSVILIQAHERARSCRVYKAAVRYNHKNLQIVQAKRVSYTFTHKPEQQMSIPVKRTMFRASFVKPEKACEDLLNRNSYDKEQDVFELMAEQIKRENAALVIQCAWKRHKAKKIYKKRMIFRKTLYGMTDKRRLIKPNQYKDSIIEMYKNELLKRQLDEDFVKLMADERVRLLQERSPWIMEDISDHIRAWFQEFYDKTEDFHPYPPAIKTGTVLVVLDETMTPVEFAEFLQEKNLSKEEKKKRREKAKLQKLKEKEKLKKERIKEAKRRKKMKAQGLFDISYYITTNKDIVNLEQAMKQYNIDWKMVDEYLNKNHEAIKEWVTEDELAVIHKELRQLVDEYMRVEYELLRKANCLDHKKKYKPQKDKKPKGKGGRKKKRQPRDPTADIPLETLYAELKEGGIIENYVNKSFSEFIADFNFVADDTRDEDRLTTIGPARGDIKMIIQDCMLGMGEFTVDKPKSLCLIGPLNNGKKLLTNIIASELDAVFMNLSPEKIYPYADKMNIFMHTVMKVAKAFQPTIIFINNVHRVFWKRVPKDQEEINPRLLAGSLKKRILKNIKNTDKVMVVGTSDAPWTAKAGLKKMFQKVILIPRSDYGTSFLLWVQLLLDNAGDDNMEDYVSSALAKALQFYSSGDISDNVKETLNVRRRMRLKAKPLDPNEFVQFFLDSSMPLFPPEQKIMDKFEKWFNNSNKLSKLRKKFLKQREQLLKKKKK